MSNKVTVVIPTHNRSLILKRTIESFSRIEPDPRMDVDLLIVGNACTDDTEQIVTQLSHNTKFPIRYVAEPVVGLNVARNRGFKESCGDIIAYLDDDVDVKPGWLKGLATAFLEHGGDLVCGRVTLWWDTTLRPSWLAPDMEGPFSKLDLGEETMIGDQRYSPIGANFACRRTVFAAAGDFMPGIDRVGKQVLSCGETEFARRARRAGAKFVYGGQMHVGHWVAPHRVNLEYMTSITNGFGRSMIFLQERFGPIQIVLRSMYHLFHLLRHAVHGMFARPDTERYVKSRMKISYNVGVLQGIWVRMTGRSPLPNAVDQSGNQRK